MVVCYSIRRYRLTHRQHQPTWTWFLKFKMKNKYIHMQFWFLRVLFFSFPVWQTNFFLPYYWTISLLFLLSALLLNIIFFFLFFPFKHIKMLFSLGDGSLYKGSGVAWQCCETQNFKLVLLNALTIIFEVSNFFYNSAAFFDRNFFIKKSSCITWQINSINK